MPNLIDSEHPEQGDLIRTKNYGQVYVLDSSTENDTIKISKRRADRGDMQAPGKTVNANEFVETIEKMVDINFYEDERSVSDEAAAMHESYLNKRMMREHTNPDNDLDEEDDYEAPDNVSDDDFLASELNEYYDEEANLHINNRGINLNKPDTRNDLEFDFDQFLLSPLGRQSMYASADTDVEELKQRLEIAYRAGWKDKERSEHTYNVTEGKHLKPKPDSRGNSYYLIGKSKCKVGGPGVNTVKCEKTNESMNQINEWPTAEHEPHSRIHGV